MKEYVKRIVLNKELKDSIINDGGLISLLNAFRRGDYDYSIKGYKVVAVRGEDAYNYLRECKTGESYLEYDRLNLEAEYLDSLDISNGWCDGEYKEDYDEDEWFWICEENTFYNIDKNPIKLYELYNYTEDNDSIYVSKYITEKEDVLESFIKANKRVIVKAQPGMGKTHYVANTKGKRVLLVPTTAIAEQQAHDTGAKVLHAKSGYEFNTDDDFIICVNGNLDKITDLKDRRLYIDEAQELYVDGFKLKGIKEYMDKLDIPKEVILLSGTWQGTTHAKLNDFKTIKFHNDRESACIEFHETNDFMTNTYKLCDDKKTMIYLPNKKEAETLAKRLRKDNKRVITINADNKKYDEQQAVINSGEFKDYDVIIFTQLLLKGWNCYEDDVRLIIHSTRISSDEITQLVERVRSRNVEVIFNTSEGFKLLNNEYDRLDIERENREEAMIQLNNWQGSLNRIRTSDKEEWKKESTEAALINTFENNISNEFYSRCVIYNGKDFEIDEDFIVTHSFNEFREYESRSNTFLAKNLIELFNFYITDNKTLHKEEIDLKEERAEVKTSAKSAHDSLLDKLYKDVYENQELNEDDYEDDIENNMCKKINILNNYVDYDKAFELMKETTSETKYKFLISRLKIQQALDNGSMDHVKDGFNKYFEFNKDYDKSDVYRLFNEMKNNDDDLKYQDYTEREIDNLMNKLFIIEVKQKRENKKRVKKYKLIKYGSFDFDIKQKVKLKSEELQKMYYDIFRFMNG